MEIFAVATMAVLCLVLAFIVFGLIKRVAADSDYKAGVVKYLLELMHRESIHQDVAEWQDAAAKGKAAPEVVPLDEAVRRAGDGTDA